MRHTKANNQFVGQYMEQAIVSVINGEEIKNQTSYSFTDEEKDVMNKHARIWAKELNAKQAIYVGRQTVTTDCDVILDGRHVELKYVSSGTGTYYNTSIYYFKNFGFDFHEYMKTMGYLDLLEKTFSKYKVSLNNNSPVSQEISSIIRHSDSKAYEEIIVPFDKEVRRKFVQDIITFFSDNQDKLQEFVWQMLTKDSDTSHKHNPECISIFDYNKEKIITINPLDYFTLGEKIIINSEEEKLGFSINNKIRVQIGWQNGNGLNNPTLRVFLEKR